MKKHKGFISLTILVSMFMIIGIVYTATFSISGLFGNYERSHKLKQNQTLGENFVYFYSAYVFEGIKDIYIATPNKEEYIDDRNDLDKMYYNCINNIYTYIRTTRNHEFRSNMQKEDSKKHIGYWIDRYSKILTQYYNISAKKYMEYSGKIYNSDFRVDMTLRLMNESKNSVTFDSQIYFHIPPYTIEDMESWLLGEKLTLAEDGWQLEDIIRASGVRIREK